MLKGLHSVVAKRLAGMGDVLMAIAALSAIKRQTGVQVFLETSAAYAGIAARCPLLDGVFTEEKDVHEHIAGVPPGKVLRVDWTPVLHAISPLHMIDSYLMAVGIGAPALAKVLELEPLADTGPDALGLPALPTGSRRILVHANVTDPNRTWPANFWNALCENLVAAGWQVVLIGKSASEDGRSIAGIDCPGVLDFTDRLSLLQTLELMRRSDLLVSGDSGPIQLAGATDIAIVGLYSVVSGANRLPFRKDTGKMIAIAPSCAFHPCYSRINDQQAVAAFAAANGMTRIDGTLFSRWCVNPDRYACVREPQTLEKVLTAIKSLLPAD